MQKRRRQHNVGGSIRHGAAENHWISVRQPLPIEEGRD